jgi:hypothetical protein
MSEFLPANPNYSAITYDSLLTERDGISRCIQCEETSPGRIDICRHRHEMVTLRKMVKVSGGSIVPQTDYKGNDIVVRLPKNKVPYMDWDAQKYEIGSIVQDKYSGYYQITDIELDGECGSKNLVWNIQFQFEEHENLRKLISDIRNGREIAPSQENTYLINRYRNFFSKDEILSYMTVAISEIHDKQNLMVNAIQELSKRVIGAGNSLLGG